MADYQEKNGQGVAFRKEKTTPNHPDYTGTFLTPKGEKLQISIWEKTSAKGTQYLSIAVSEPFVKTEQRPAPAQPRETKHENMDSKEEQSDLPF